MPRTILVTGFGPFPGAPRNPTAKLVARLGRMRHVNARVIAYVFETSYAAVDRELPALIEKHRPDALLMFGLHGRARNLRIETLAANALGRHADVSGRRPTSKTIAPGVPSKLRLPMPPHRLLRAAQSHGAVLSRDAGRYLCNYLCWKAIEATTKPGGPRFAAFVHVPPVRDKTQRPGSRRLTAARLEKAGAAILAALSAS